MLLPIGELAQAAGGSFDVEPADVGEQICGLTWDSRDVRPGEAYAALPGERVDGRDFARAALRAGARVVLTGGPLPADALDEARERGAAVVRVDDAAAAIARLAGAWRGHLGGRVIGLTGSSGKTTTKNLVRDVLAVAFPVTATAANQNNELGVPKTLLSANADDGAVVVEMGMRGTEQIAQLCDLARPEWGLVTNVGTSHLELLGSRENIARAKAELLEALPEGGWAFLNGDDDYAAFMRDHARLRERGVKVAVYDGSPEAAGRMNLLRGAKLPYDDGEAARGSAVRRSDARVWAEDIALDEEGRATFCLVATHFPAIPESDSVVERASCTLSLRGLHNVANACAAAAVGRALGMPLPAIAAALAAAQPESGRAHVLRTVSGVTVMDDSYNANPDSMRASLRTFAAMRAEGRKIAVLGDMGELGAYSDEGHLRVGADAAAAGVDALVCVGPLARGIARGAREAGLAAERIACVPDAAAALAFARESVRAGDAVLVKASHAVGLEQVVEGLVG